MTTHSSMVNLVRKLDKLLMFAYILKMDVSVSYRKKDLIFLSGALY